MKTDKELLELVARAAGVSGEWVEDFNQTHDYFYSGSRSGFYFDETGNGDFRVWNPLTDDGDALRLAVELNIAFVFDFNLSTGESFIRAGVEVPTMIVERVLDNDRLSATRRAIVRAAAAIGERL